MKTYDRVTTNKIYVAITNHFKEGGFKWRQLNINSPARIYCDNAEIRLDVMEYLKQNNVEFNTYTDSTSRLRAFIVRGLAHGNDDVIINDISNILESYGITGPIKIERFFTGNMKRKSETASSLFKIVLGADADVSKITTIKQIGSFQVSIEKMKRSSTIQCHNCQRFHHTANQCNYQYRCVQCVHQHPPGQCQRKTNKQLPLGCVNCKEHKLDFAGHTANNLKACGFYNNQSGNNSNGGKKNLSNNNSTKNTTKQQQPSKHTDGLGGRSTTIIGDVRANNPGQTNKKTKRSIKYYRPNAVNGKSNQPTKNNSTPKTRNNIDNGDNGRIVGSLVADLLTLLHRYT